MFWIGARNWSIIIVIITVVIFDNAVINAIFQGFLEDQWIHLFVFGIKLFKGVPNSLFDAKKNVHFIFRKKFSHRPKFWAICGWMQFCLHVVGDFSGEFQKLFSKFLLFLRFWLISLPFGNCFRFLLILLWHIISSNPEFLNLSN